MIDRLLRAVKERLAMPKPSVEDVVARWTDRPIVLVDTHADVDVLIEALVEATAELIYLRQFGKDGADWWHADHKDAWRDKARNALKGEP